MSQTILVISPIIPSSLHAGGKRILDIYTNIKRIRKDCKIVLILFVSNKILSRKDSSKFKNIFDDVYFIKKKISLRKFILQNKNLRDYQFNVIDLQYTPSGKYISDCRFLWPSSLVILSVMDSSLRSLIIFLRNNWKNLFFPWISFLKLIKFSFLELIYISLSDKVITVSEADKLIVNKFIILNRATSTCLPTCEFYDQKIFKINKKNNKTIVYFAYFKSKTNIESLLWFCLKVHPLILKKVPDYTFRIVGYGLDMELKKKLSKINNVKVIGSVSNINDALNNSNVGIIPALSGSGIRGKIHQYSLAKIPSVASKIAVEGLKYEHNKSIMLATNAYDFSKFCTYLLLNKSFARKIALSAKKLCLDEYVWSKKLKDIKNIYDI